MSTDISRTPNPAATAAFSTARVAAMVWRYWYLLRSSWPRLLDLVYWPAVQMLMWGFLQHYISQNAGFFARAGGTFIGALLLWDILFRGQLGFSISFLEEMWSRNMANLMISPLRPLEFVIALTIMSVVRLAIGGSAIHADRRYALAGASANDRQRFRHSRLSRFCCALA